MSEDRSPVWSFEIAIVQKQIAVGKLNIFATAYAVNEAGGQPNVVQIGEAITPVIQHLVDFRESG